eukprot:12915570-Alexandrium_andersonii.AAC.1
MGPLAALAALAVDCESVVSGPGPTPAGLPARPLWARRRAAPPRRPVLLGRGLPPSAWRRSPGSALGPALVEGRKKARRA